MTKTEYMEELHKLNRQNNDLAEIVRQYMAYHQRTNTGGAPCNCRICEQARFAIG